MLRMGVASDPSRRQFMKKMASAAAAACASPHRLVRALRGSTNAAYGTASADAPSREKLFQFRYSDVKLTGGPLKDQFDRIHTFYQGLDEDRVLKVYRQRAGLPAPGEDMGGWYDADAFAPGHCLGQFISGLARFADATGDAATQAKVKRLVDGFAATVSSDGFCYASQRAAIAFPAYTYDKHVIGLLDAYQFAGDTSALEVMERATQGALRHLPPRALDRQFEALTEAPDDESYTLAENQFYAYEVTGKREHLEMAERFLLDKTYFEPLARGENVLPGRHAYSHVNALSSAARAYLAQGEPKHLETARNAWDMLEKTQWYASGGWGPNETFIKPGQGLLAGSLPSTHAHVETPCGSYAHFKLARYLLRVTADAHYGDGLERALYNTILGVKDPQGDRFFYYSDYHPATQKTFFPDKYPCCAGTLPQVVADYTISAYFWNSDGVFVNLFTPSEVRLKLPDPNARLIQATDYPAADSTELRLELSVPAEFTVGVRIPSWLRSPARLAVNGKEASVPAEPGTFAHLRRRWQNHDAIQVTLPFSFRTEPIDDQYRDLAALMHGPLMLVALEPGLKLPSRALDSPGMLEPVPYTPLSFEVLQPPEKIRFVPFYAVKEEAYTTYVTQL